MTRSVVFLACASSIALSASLASADACTEAFVSSQDLRKQHRLLEARPQFAACAQNECSDEIRSKCAAWLFELQQGLPTVVFEAHGADGKEIHDVRVLADGRVIAERLDGTAIAIDPGVRKLRYEHAGATPIEEQVTVHEGEKNRKVTIAFGSPDDKPKPAAVLPPPPAPPSKGISPVIPVLGAIGVVGMGVFATFGILGKIDEGKLEDVKCAPYCQPDRVTPIRTKYAVADVALGVGGAALVGAGVALIVHLASRPAVVVQVAPVTGGARASARLAF